MIDLFTVTEQARQILIDVSGIELNEDNAGTPLTELGFTTDMLENAGNQLDQHFGVSVISHFLMEDYCTYNVLVAHLDEAVSAGILTHLADQSTNQSANLPVDSSSKLPGSEFATFRQLMQKQLSLMTQQLQILNRIPFDEPVEVPTEEDKKEKPQSLLAKRPLAPVISPEDYPKTDFGSYQPIAIDTDDALTKQQKERLREMMTQLIRQTSTSKKIARAYRDSLADPSAINNFHKIWKEVVYQIVCKRSARAHLWDMNDNQYIDITMGNGAHLFGHSPRFLVKAVRWQIDHSLEVGALSPLAGEVARFIHELTGMERVAVFDSAGEALRNSIRLARSATGREHIVYFTHSAHHSVSDLAGSPAIVDERLHSLPAFSGIPNSAVENSYILPYGHPRSVEFIQQHIDELAAVILEPVPSHHPQLHSQSFVKQLRQLTENGDIPLIFDETVTGFRVRAGGLQSEWDIQADMVCYGNNVSGGFPCGILAGSREYLQELDGGKWEYGDTSTPQESAGWHTPSAGNTLWYWRQLEQHCVILNVAALAV